MREKVAGFIFFLAAVAAIGSFIFDFDGFIRSRPNPTPTPIPATSVPSEVVEAYIAEGQRLFSQGFYAEALQEYDKAITLDPTHAVALNDRGVIHHHQGNYADAIKDLTPAINFSNGEYYQAHFNLANAYFAQGQLDKAIREYTTALDIHPDYLDALQRRGLAHHQLGLANQQPTSFNIAIDDYTAAINLSPENGILYVWRADSYYELGQMHEANDDYALASTLIEEDEFDQVYTFAVSNESETATIRRYEGLFHFLSGSNDEAINSYLRAIELDPDYIQAYYGWGIVLTDENKIAEAVAVYRTAIEIDPTFVPVLSNLSHLYIEQKLYVEAITEATQAITLDEQYAPAYINRGNAYERLGDEQASAEDFWKWIELNRQNPPTILNNVSLPSEMPGLAMDDGIVYHISFFAGQGQRLTLMTITRENSVRTLDPLLVLLDTDNNPLTGSDDSGTGRDALIDDYVVPSDGIYTLILSHAGGGSEGFVTVRLTVENP